MIVNYLNINEAFGKVKKNSKQNSDTVDNADNNDIINSTELNISLHLDDMILCFYDILIDLEKSIPIHKDAPISKYISLFDLDINSGIENSLGLYILNSFNPSSPSIPGLKYYKYHILLKILSMINASLSSGDFIFTISINVPRINYGCNNYDVKKVLDINDEIDFLYNICNDIFDKNFKKYNLDQLLHFNNIKFLITDLTGASYIVSYLEEKNIYSYLDSSVFKNMSMLITNKQKLNLVDKQEILNCAESIYENWISPILPNKNTKIFSTNLKINYYNFKFSEEIKLFYDVLTFNKKNDYIINKNILLNSIALELNDHLLDGDIDFYFEVLKEMLSYNKEIKEPITIYINPDIQFYKLVIRKYTKLQKYLKNISDLQKTFSDILTIDIKHIPAGSIDYDTDNYNNNLLISLFDFEDSRASLPSNISSLFYNKNKISAFKLDGKTKDLSFILSNENSKIINTITGFDFIDIYNFEEVLTNAIFAKSNTENTENNEDIFGIDPLFIEEITSSNKHNISKQFAYFLKLLYESPTYSLNVGKEDPDIIKYLNGSRLILYNIFNKPLKLFKNYANGRFFLILDLNSIKLNFNYSTGFYINFDYMFVVNVPDFHGKTSKDGRYESKYYNGESTIKINI